MVRNKEISLLQSGLQFRKFPFLIGTLHCQSRDLLLGSCVNLIGNDIFRDCLKGVQRLFFLRYCLRQILLDLGDLVIIFLKIVNGLIAVPADVAGDHLDLAGVSMDLVPQKPSFFQNLSIPVPGFIAQKHISTAKHQDKRKINTHQINHIGLF